MSMMPMSIFSRNYSWIIVSSVRSVWRRLPENKRKSDFSLRNEPCGISFHKARLIFLERKILTDDTPIEFLPIQRFSFDIFGNQIEQETHHTQQNHRIQDHLDIISLAAEGQ